MPKIPMSNKAGFIRHVSDTVHMQGAPGMNWGMEEGQALSNLGDQISRGANHLGNAVMAFGRHMQHQEDVLAATEDRNLFSKLNGELRNKLANNPGASDEEKQDWINGYKQLYEDERKPFLDKMSGNFRKQHDAEMNSLRIKAQNDRDFILKQGAVQRVTDLTLEKLKDAALRSDEKEYRRILNEAQEGEFPLFSAEKYAMLEQKYYRLSDFGAANAMLETVPPDQLIEQLKAKNDGGYANFTHLPEDRREIFIRKAEAKQGQIEKDFDLQVIASYQNDAPMYDSDEAIDAAFAQGDINAKQRVRYKEWNKKYYRQKQHSAAKAGNDQRQRQIDQFISDTLYDENGRARALNENTFAAAAKKAREICGEDYASFDQTLRKLNAAYEKKTAYRDTPLYKDGDLLISEMKAENKLYAIKEGWLWNGKDLSFQTEKFIERSLRMDLENFVQDHPKATQVELTQYLNNRLEFYQKNTLAKIAAGVLQERTVQRGAGKAGSFSLLKAGDERNGWIFQGGDPADKKNWKRK